jgi:hypothetical protein
VAVAVRTSRLPCRNARNNGNIHVSTGVIIRLGPISMVLLYLFAATVAFGAAVALAFVAVGVEQVQPMPVTVGARILLLPGALVLWPLVLARWIKSRGGR